MDWNAISAIGTIVASIVGIAGIWINLWEKTKRLSIQFFAVPCFKILICNSSLRTVAVTKVVYSLKGRPFHVEYFDGLHEMILPPASTQSISIDKQDIYSSSGFSAVSDRDQEWEWRRSSYGCRGAEDSQTTPQPLRSPRYRPCK